MNDRIKELADQCREQYTVIEDGEDWSHMHFNEEKFAELIIRECIDVCCSIDMGSVSTEILEHFGIE